MVALDNDLETGGCWYVGRAMGNGSSVKEAAAILRRVINKDGIHKALEHFGVITEKCLSVETTTLIRLNLPTVKMDERTQEEPQARDAEGATHRADFLKLKN